MKKLFFILALGCALMACRSDLDLSNVDGTADVNLGLALPVGSIKMTLADMVGEVEGLYIDSLNNKGVLTWKYDTTRAEAYHDMDLAQYISKAEITLNIYDQIKEKYPFLVNLLIPTMPMDTFIVLDFPLDLPLTGINEDKTVKERLDSAIIEEASFYSILRPTNLPFGWDCVDSIVLDLGPRFSRPAGNHMCVYAKSSGASYDYGDSIPLMVDKFTLNMMKNTHPTDYSGYQNNVYDTCSFNVHFRFSLKKGMPISLNSGSVIKYEMGARFLNFKAIWGMFEPSNQMNKEEVIDMNDFWKSFDFLSKSRMPFTDPVIKTQIITHVAGALCLDSTYIFTLNANNDTAFAMFYDIPTKWFHQPFFPGEYLDPIKSAIGDSATNMYVTFNKSNNGGRIHNLFLDMPQKLGYKFRVGFLEETTPQIRITPNTTIRVRSTITLPFMFGDSTYIEYPQTTGVSLSQLSIDSLQHQSDIIDTIKASNVKLVMKAVSTIPLDLKYTMRCLDEKGNVVKDPNDTTKDFLLFTQDTIRLAAPTMTYDEKTYSFTSNPQESVFMVDLTKKQLNVFPKIKKIKFTAVLDNYALDEAYRKGLPSVQLHSYDYVTMKIGLAANVEGVFNFGKNDK